MFTPKERSPRSGRRASLAFSGNKRVIAYPYESYVTQVRAARDSLRALATREEIYYSTVGVATEWDVAEGTAMSTMSTWSTTTNTQAGESSMAMKNPPHPGCSIRENCLVPLGLNVTEAARVLGVARHTLARATSPGRRLPVEVSMPPEGLS